jgi:hypothetical protein
VCGGGGGAGFVCVCLCLVWVEKTMNVATEIKKNPMVTPSAVGNSP